MPIVGGGFHWVDYVVFFITIAVSLGIGIFFAVAGGKNKSTEEYLVGDRQMRLLPVAISMLVSFVSSIGILGNPAEVYQYGMMYMLYTVAASLGCMYGIVLFVPLLYPLKLTSAFEYYGMRYNTRIAKLCGSLIALFNQIVFNGIQLFAPAVALAGVSRAPTWATLIICGTATTIYTTIGGMKAVIWTDCFQCGVIFLGLCVITIKGTMQVGGVERVFEVNEEWGRVKFFDFDPDPTKRMSFWSVVVVNSILWMCLTGTQASVQRYCALPSMNKARLAVLLNIPGFLVIGLLTCMTGVVAFAHYASIGCDPIRAGYITNPNQILPYYVMEQLHYPGLPGLFVACLFSASLSSVSSSLNAMAAITWKDLLEPHWGHLEANRQATITKCCAMFYGVLAIAMGFIVELIGGTLIQITYSIIGCTAGPIVGMFLVGGSIPRAGPIGTIFGAMFGFVISMWLSIGASFTNIVTPPMASPIDQCGANISVFLNSSDVYSAYSYSSPQNLSIVTEADFQNSLTGVQRLYALSYLWYPAIGIASCFIFGGISSFIPALRQKGHIPPRLLFPCCRSRCCECCMRDPAMGSYDIDDEDKNEMYDKPFLDKEENHNEKTEKVTSA